jgi:hypothetical protein
MSTIVWPAQGTTLGIDEISGNSNTFSLINNITSMDGLFGGTVAQAKTSSLTSTTHTYRGTLKDPDEIGIDFWYDPTDAVHRFVRDWNDTPTNGPYTLQGTFNTGNTNSTATALANISGFSPSADDVESNLAAHASFKITNTTTWNAS